MDKCENCYYNREMTAWGEKIEACHFSLEKGNVLYGRADDPTYCSGYEPAEKQLELAFD